MSDKGTTVKASDVPLWVKGDPLKASKLNETVNAVNALKARAAPPVQATPATPSFGLVYQFKIVSIQGDYLTCNPYDGVNPADTGTTVYIAKPYLLRNTVTSRNGITFAYSGTQTRTATQGATNETQVVVPSYVAGDVIYALRGVVGKLPLNGSSQIIEHLDINADGRAWAKQ